MPYYSQFGSERILAVLWEEIGVTNKTCCEIGAADGLSYSNTAYWILEHGWTGTMVETDDEQFKKAQAAYQGKPVTVLNDFVTIENINALVPKDLDFLSIDIDGNDYWVFKQLDRTPRVVMLEYNEHFKDRMEIMVYKPQFRLRPGMKEEGASRRAMASLLEEKGYHVAYDDRVCNLIGVHQTAESSQRLLERWRPK